MIIRLLKSLLGDRRGGTAIEYGLIAALVVIAMIASLTQVANTTVGMWGNVSAQVSAARSAN
ncbi:Flp family type IVb pilin [Sphingomonas sp. 10B4]|uniref:Flp family type IVb pilin n=1 Tax=Sphingomonas sp. 10B4 TaxID=3048575 RepID=UPI002AB4DED8|nr:Flp family type IVb pilin [Sphingomonas sp. 10B4]MDY7525219.1 Flp family type IVb pilin [Sphingomonas sp. 10B4]MEB0282043.1 Flp family type IVb pilin [Sphingomonas sp. 10B4]